MTQLQLDIPEQNATPAWLVLEDGAIFRGYRFGAMSDVGGEVVFNTSMTGYQEILGDPSYARQMVVMTYPMMGNYGIAAEDYESRHTFLSAFIVKEPSGIASNWRHEHSLDDYLKAQNIPGLFGIDTRSLVRHLRDRGAMRGRITAPVEETKIPALVAAVGDQPSMAGQDLASVVTVDKPYEWRQGRVDLSQNDNGASNGAHKTAVAEQPGAPFKVVVYDFGVKYNILRSLVDVGCELTVVPASTPAADVLALKPDGVMLSNGPGDPEPVTYAIENIKQLLGQVPIMGICLGHQLMCLAAGGRSYKLKFGHRGANHPVQQVKTGKVEITSQNHGFAIDTESLPKDEVEVTHVNLNDQTLSGIAFRNIPAFGVQYHPEAAPGPHDANYLFKQFAQMMCAFKEGHTPA